MLSVERLQGWRVHNLSLQSVPVFDHSYRGKKKGNTVGEVSL